MSRTPEQRDEELFLRIGRIASHLESEGLLKTVDTMREIIEGTKDTAGISVRVKNIETQIAALIKSNAQLQKALYIATGVYIAAKAYFEYLAPHK